MTNKNRYALITGASQGFGKILALELARRDINVVLVALPGENTNLVANECRELGVQAEIYEADLTNRDELLKMTRWVNNHFNVFILINNAGLGGTRIFHTSELQYIENLINLNVMATSLITHQLLPNLLQQPRGYIMNVSSMASFSPIGFKTVYSSTKRYVQHFSQSLNQELKDTSVSVSVVLPGPMKTNAEIIKRIIKQGIIAKIGLTCPYRAARVSINRLFRKKSFILVGRRNHINRFMLALIPSGYRMSLMTRGARREIDKKTDLNQSMK